MKLPELPFKEIFTKPQITPVYSSLTAKDIVSVQPMSLPSSLIFYLEYQYGKRKNKPNKRK